MMAHMVAPVSNEVERPLNRHRFPFVAIARSEVHKVVYIKRTGYPTEFYSWQNPTEG